MRLHTFALLGDIAESVLKSVGTIGLFLIIFAESGLMFGFFLPGDSLLFIAGLLSYTGVLANIVVVSLGCWLAACLGDQVGYATGKKWGPGLFQRPDSRFFKQEYLREAEAFFERHGSKTIMLARWVPVVRTFAPIVAGATKMDYKKFTMYNIIGGGVWAVGFTQAGYWLGQKYPKLGENMELVVLVIVVASLIPLAIHMINKKRKASALAKATANETV